MSLSPSETEELGHIAAAMLPASIPAIHALAAIYNRYGTHSAREVTDLLDRPTAGGVFGHFGGFIRESDSRGFRAEVADPDIDNPQTGHFFSFVIWALDGISEFETAAALGHEFVHDTIPLHEAAQLLAGTGEARAFRDFLTAQPLDPNGTLDYAALDAEFVSHGWAGDIDPHGRLWNTDWPLVAWETDTEVHSGNSLQDLRCTVAGFHFGRLIRSGCFRTAADAARWLERNLLEGGACRVVFNGETPSLIAR